MRIIKSIAINSWRQFKNVNIDFHPQLTILTGANGAGKTTILDLINQHFGFVKEFVSLPERLNKSGEISYNSTALRRYSTSTMSTFGYLDNYETAHGAIFEIGKFKYEGDEEANIIIPVQVSSVYNITIEPFAPLKGFNISSHRPHYKYNRVENISTQPVGQKDLFHHYHNLQRHRYLHNSLSNQAETYHIKQALLSLSTLGYGNIHTPSNEMSVRLFEGFIEILRLVLPENLGFKTISVRSPEIVFVTESGEFPIDSVSGGVASIIDLAWQIYLFDDSDGYFITVIDEPENHLHPEMQKSLLPNFIRAFPRTQFIVASHSPFIISSVLDSNVYALRYNDSNKVFAELLDNADKSGSANEILREILGIETTTPNWINSKINHLIDKYNQKGALENESIESFKHDMKEVGLDKFVTQSVFDLISRRKNDKAE